MSDPDKVDAEIASIVKHAYLGKLIDEFVDFAIDEGYIFGYWDTRMGCSEFESIDDEQLKELVKKFSEK